MVVLGLELGWWDVPDVGVEPGFVEPVNPVEGGELRIVDAAPGPFVPDQFGLVETDRSINALAETINGLYKTECIRTTVFHDGPYKTLADVEYATAGWVDWYNNRRLHGSFGNIPPVEYEQAHYAALKPEPQPA